MKSARDPDVLIKAFLEAGVDELPDHSYDVVRASIESTRQRVVFGPWREDQMSRYAGIALAAAAIVVIAVLGIRFLPGSGLIGGQPTTTPVPTASPAPTPEPTSEPTPSPSPSPVADPSGRLGAGSYLAHPFPEPNRAFTFKFDVPSDTWDSLADPGTMFAINRDDVGLGFLMVSSLNADPCTWSGDENDVAVGPSVDDLVSALASQTAYDMAAASNVSLAGYSGKKVVVTMPDTLSPDSSENVGCDEGNFRIWNATGFDLYAQGPENRWTMWILDVEGQRVVILTSDYATSSAANRAELESIVDSIVITP